KSAGVAMGQGLFSIPKHLRVYFSLWRRGLLGRQIFRERQRKTPFPRQHPHCHWGAASRYWWDRYPFGPRGDLVYHRIRRTYFQLFVLRHDATVSLRIRACKSADLGMITVTG